MVTNSHAQDEKTFFDTVRNTLLTSVPVLSALIFVVVSVKVFRAALMDTTTTVAIVSTADVVALLKGVILTLLPGFLAALTAAAIWWWAGVLPTRLDRAHRDEAQRGLFSPQALWAWAMIVTAFFTVWWPIFLVLLVPVLGTTTALVSLSLGRPTRQSSVVRESVPSLALVAAAVIGKFVVGYSWQGLVVCVVPLVVIVEAFRFPRRPRSQAALPLRGPLKVFALVAAATFIGLLTLQPNVWLPLRTITFKGAPYTLQNVPLPTRIAAYVLNRDSDTTSLLLAHPRAVIEVKNDSIDSSMPLCVPPPSSGRVLTTRASQVLKLDPDPHTPYDICPELEKHLFSGG